MNPKMDYEHIADALSQAIKAYICCNEEITDCCRYELLSALEMSIHSLQLSLSVLLGSYSNWQVSLELPDSTVARYGRYLRFSPSLIRQNRESCWFK